MRKICWVLVFTLFCTSVNAVQRVVIYDSKDRKGEIKKWQNDGDIHLIDFELKKRKFSKNKELLKVAMPHHGIWIKNITENLPENIDVRYAHITSSLTWLRLRPNTVTVPVTATT
ncbi:MAG: hypothetical protein ACYTFY_16680 [Planctomycetota bacterium]|jgi:hypothetical protein